MTENSSADRAVAAFRETFGGEPAGVWAAPGRVNLIGEHTDYNAGLCLPIALPQRTYAAFRTREDGLLRMASTMGGGVVEVPLDDVAPGTPAGWSGYVAGVPWALRRAGFVVGGFDVVVHSDVPVGAGLSSSAALEGCVAAALSDVHELGLLADDAGRAILADACRAAENEIAGAPTGGLDQASSLRCKAGHALLLDFQDNSAVPVPFDLAAHGLALLVVDTRAPHALVDGQYASRRQACEEAAAILGVASLREVTDLDAALEALDDDVLRRRVRHVVTEIERVTEAITALEQEDFAWVGDLFNASHDSLRWDYEVTCPELDVTVETARVAGALGARMTGGGFGGSAIALVRASEADAVVDAVRKAFAHHGFGEPGIFVVDASEGAARVD